MTKNKLEEIYFTKYMQAGDTDLDFYEWAIKYLLKQVKKCQNCYPYLLKKEK